MSKGVTGLRFAFDDAPGYLNISPATLVEVVSDTTATVILAPGLHEPTGPWSVSATRDETPPRPPWSYVSCVACVTVTNPLPAGPTVDTVTPATLARGSVTAVDLKGSALAGATSASVTTGGVPVKAVVSVSTTKVRLRLSVDANATPGPRTITLNMSNGQTATATIAVA